VIGYFVRHPTAANLLMLVIILLGILGASSLNREVFPEFASDYINVRVIYRGASAEEVEQTICRLIEEEIEGIEGIERVEAIAREGLAVVTVEVADGYEVRDVLKDIENAIDQIDNFPVNIEPPLVFEVKPILRVCTLSVWTGSDGEDGDSDAALAAGGRLNGAGEPLFSEKDLLILAETIKDELLALDEVSLIETDGFSDHQIRIEVRRRDMLAHGLTINDVAREIAAGSLDLPSGSVETSEREIKIRVVDQRRRAEDFRDLTVKVNQAGARIPLRSVAKVTDTFEDEWLITRYRGHRCVNLEVSKTDNADTISVAGAVKRYVDERQEALPPGVHLTQWSDYSFYVKDRLGMLIENGILGFVLVFLTLWLLLNVRLSFWVAVGIPISFLGALWLMGQLDISLNMITMFSLIMAVGIIVDDAIVIGENIYAHYCRGKTPSQAAIDGTKEVSLGVVASMLTTVAVFMPLLWMAGDVGKIMRLMPIGVVTALSVSIVEGFFILPHHLKQSLQRMPKKPARLRAAIDRFMKWFIHEVYGPVLHWSLKRPAIPLAAVVMLLMISLGMLLSGRLRFQLFPELDGDFIVAEVELPKGTDLDRTERILTRIEDAVWRMEDAIGPQPNGQRLIKHFATSFGFGRRMDPGPGGQQTGSHIAQVFIELLTADQRTAQCDEILRLWRDEVGHVTDVVNMTFEQLQITPGGKPIDIQLRGKDLDELKRASLDLQAKIAEYAGVRNLTDNLRPGEEEILVRLKPSGRPLGITSAALAEQLRGAFWGSIAQEFQRGSDNFEVEVQFAPEDRRSLTDLEDFKVRTPTGQTRPLHEVATCEKVRGYSQIVRVDRRRTISVTGDLDTRKGNATKINDDLEDNFFPRLLADYPGVSLYLEGQRRENEKTTASLKVGFLIGLAMIFILLSFVFQSFIEPLIVMAVIPFGLVGAIAGHILLGFDWTMPSSIGFISLSGIVVNDSIVLVSFIKLRLREGKGVHEAVHLAGMQRFRAVFLTSATTVAGLLPMMLETSLQAQFLIPMAVSITFGLMFATVVVLLLVPCLYSILSRLGWAQKIVAD
jgi:hydrophobic/amphiphilic exporter-1 (mainly G- bacteria), HAE1 family